MTDTRTRAPETYFPSGEDYDKLLDRRTRRAFWMQMVLMSALIVAVLALATLLWTIVNDSFGIVGQVNQVEPEQIVESFGYDPAEVGFEDLTFCLLYTSDAADDSALV